MARVMIAAIFYGNRLSSSVDQVFLSGGWDINEAPLLYAGMLMVHRLMSSLWLLGGSIFFGSIVRLLCGASSAKNFVLDGNSRIRKFRFEMWCCAEWTVRSRDLTTNELRSTESRQ
jgi:hypothetical protein